MWVKGKNKKRKIITKEIKGGKIRKNKEIGKEKEKVG